MIMGFITQMKAEGHAVESTCAVLNQLGVKVAARTWRKHAAARTLSPVLLALAYLANTIHTLAYAWDPATGSWRLRPEGLYGRRKMRAALARAGTAASGGRVHAAMALLGHTGVTRSRKIRTTVPGKDGHRAGDLLNRDFTAPAPNMVWVTDFTYVRTWSGFVYVAFIVDVYAQRILAWHVQATKTTDLVMTPLKMALWERGRQANPPTPGQLIHHSDAGSQYTSVRLTSHLSAQEVRPSIGTVGDAYDNALMESIIGLYKAECIGTDVFGPGEREYKTLLDVELATAGWVTWWNHERLHTSIGDIPPAEHEANHYAHLTTSHNPV